MTIPLIVHQIWMNPEETEVITHPPPEIAQMMTTWSRSSYTYMLWNHITMRQYIEMTEPSFLEIYDALPLWIERCDIFRYFVLYHMGGIYTDADTVRTGTLEPLLRDRKVIITKNTKGEVSNYFIASAPGVDLMRSLYLNVDTKDKFVFTATGPYYVAKQMLKHPGTFTMVMEEDLPVKHTSSKTWVGGQLFLVYDLIGHWLLYLVLIFALALLVWAVLALRPTSVFGITGR